MPSHQERVRRSYRKVSWRHRFIHWIGWAPSTLLHVDEHGTMILVCRVCRRVTVVE